MFLRFNNPRLIIFVIIRIIAILSFNNFVIASSTKLPWMELTDTPGERAKKLAGMMNITEKTTLMTGEGWWPAGNGYVGSTAAIPRLKIPALYLNDGPQGFRTDGGRPKQPQIIPKSSTAFPAGLTVAASWDPAVARAWGKAMGEEFAAKGANVQLGPGMCLARVPVNGRNFEYASGEDPKLGSVIIGPVVDGIQSQGVIANAKHWVMNNQETNRGIINSVVDERTRFELYYPPFKSAIDAGVGSFMCGYNKINGYYSCENNSTLKIDLKERLGFEGWIMSDWGATHSTIPSILAELDQQMPGSGFYGQKLIDAVKNGQLTMDDVDEKVIRILTQMFKIGLFDRPNNGSITANVTSNQHNKVARHVAAQSTVMLKNDDALLPISSHVQQIAIIGQCASDSIVAGRGSGFVDPSYIVSGLEGIKNRFPGVNVTFTGNDQKQAATFAAAADIAIVFVATNSGEGKDRENLNLDDPYDDLVLAVAKVQAKTVVVIDSPGAVLLPWADEVAAILVAFMPGQQAGNAIADILSGDVPPSGKLPITFPNKENEVGFTKEQYPGVNNISNYSEKLEVGYRWYHQHNVIPKFAFGHGLSYTTFMYSSLNISGTDVVFNLTNTGEQHGSDVAQLYITYPKEAGEPPKQLKGFEKVELLKGTSRIVTLSLSEEDLSIWDANTHQWSPQHGSFDIFIGSSSQDIRLKGTLQY